MRFSRLKVKHILADVAGMVGASFLALYLRDPGNSAFNTIPEIYYFLPLLVAARLATFMAMGVYDIIWRYISLADAFLIVKAILISSAINIALVHSLGLAQIRPRLFFLSMALFTLYALGIRVLRRYLHEYPSASKVKKEGRRVLVFGAGTNGRTLVQRLGTDHDVGYQVMGFVDDDPEKKGRVIAGLSILGTGDELEELLQRTGATELIVAIGKPSGALLLRVMQICIKRGIRPRVIKKVTASLSHTNRLEIARDIELNDLLNRPRRQILSTALSQLISGRRVLITGAGGSIGSEIAKQVYELEPKKLLVLDHAEYQLYEIDQALNGSSSNNTVVPLLADIKDRNTLRQIFRDHRPEIVIHAAAYKHVHLVETNPHSAILNNVMGTQNLLELSEDFEISTFLLISSDKAVNPVGVMGATKRLCELLVSAAGERTGKCYASVRFGNVLGSSGSLIPLLKEQILAGKPITITHQDMKRFFMLIPEAVALVLRAATLARPGDVMVLNMGEPVRILDLARSLIVMMGKTENEVPIVFTGMRPGEKLYEELYLTGAELSTQEPDILVAPRGDLTGMQRFPLKAFDEQLSELFWGAFHGHPSCVPRLFSLIRGEGLFLSIEEAGLTSSNLERPETFPN